MDETGSEATSGLAPAATGLIDWALVDTCLAADDSAGRPGNDLGRDERSRTGAGALSEVFCSDLAGGVFFWKILEKIFFMSAVL